MSQTAQVAVTRLGRAVLSDRMTLLEQAAGDTHCVDTIPRLMQLAEQVSNKTNQAPTHPTVLVRLTTAARHVGAAVVGLIPTRL